MLTDADQRVKRGLEGKTLICLALVTNILCTYVIKFCPIGTHITENNKIEKAYCKHWNGLGFGLDFELDFGLSIFITEIFFLRKFSFSLFREVSCGIV